MKNPFGRCGRVRLWFAGKVLDYKMAKLKKQYGGAENIPHDKLPPVLVCDVKEGE
jgi:hypothetical protein